MLSKQRIPDLIVIACLGLLWAVLSFTGTISLVSDYLFFFLLTMYFLGRAVTWYIIQKHTEDQDRHEDN